MPLVYGCRHRGGGNKSKCTEVSLRFSLLQLFPFRTNNFLLAVKITDELIPVNATFYFIVMYDEVHLKYAVIYTPQLLVSGM